MSKAYFWKNKEVISITSQPYISLVDSLGYSGLPCVDLYGIDEEGIYGYFLHNGGWRPIPYADFPKDFLTAILLIS